jgi:galactose mutarotase-like enzyme
MYTIENELLKVTIRSTGAELSSIYNKAQQLEYLWSGDPAFWAKQSPVLFPIVGTLKSDTYFFNDKAYHLGRHGFARDMEFMVTTKAADSVTFTLQSNADTLAKFPFAFRFDITYTIAQSQLLVNYTVANSGAGSLYFSVGAHPAFKLPLVDNTAYEDYSLVFNHTENTGRWPISPEGLIDAAPEPFLDHTDRLPLRKELFYKDALVFKQLKSDTITLSSPKTTHGWSVSFPGFPYMGIWAAKNADFVCIEPWCGIADSVSTDQQLIHKEGIVTLKKGQTYVRQWTLELW